MAKVEMSTRHSESLSEQLTRRVLLLGLIGVVGLSSTIVLGLLVTLQQVQNRMDEVNIEAVRTFDLFFLDIQSDLLATSDSLATRDDVELALLQIRARNESFLDVLFVNFDGTVLAQRNAVGRPMRTKIEQQSWLEFPPPFGEAHVGPVGFEGQAPFVDMMVTATDDIGLPSGILLVRVDLTELWNTTLDIKVGEMGYAYIADDAGQLVAYRNRRLLETGSNLTNLVGRAPQAIAESRLSFYTGLSNQLVLASAQPLKVVPWFAIVEQPIGEALAPFLIPVVILLTILVMVGLLLYNIVKFTRVRIVSPLLSLRDVVGRMTGGQLSQRIEVRQNDELGQLAHSFNSMASQLQQAFETLEDRVAERERAEEALREEQAFIEAALNSQRDTFFVFDPSNGRAVRWNRAFAEISGYSDEEIAVMKAPDAWYSEEDLKRAAATTEKIFQEGRATVEMHLITKDKRTIPFEYVASSIKDVEGDPQYIIAIGRDITERKRVEEALRRERDFSTSLIQTSPAFIVAIAPDGKTEWMNKAMLDALGYEEQEVIGRDYPSMFVPEAEYEMLSGIFRSLQEEGASKNENHVVAKGGQEFLVEWYGKPVCNKVGQVEYFFGIGLDITERRRIEEELRRYREHLEELVEARTAELQRANDELAREITERKRVEEALRRAKQAAEQARTAAEAANRAKSAFLANMSHELRTPLNAILGFTQLMRRDPTFASGQRDNLRIIHQSGEHLLELINDVLEMSKIEAGRATFAENDFDLYQLLDILENMFDIRARNKGLRLRFERAPDVPQYIRTDERKLRQVLINLLSNAIKFTEAGGVTLRISESANQRTSDLQTCRLVFEVQDTGAGIAPEEMEHLFEAFTQTASGQEVLEGTGLGLALSRRFVQLMGGDIAVESPPSIPFDFERNVCLGAGPPAGGGVRGGVGSVFRFDIRVAVVEAGAVEPRQPVRRVVSLAPGQRATDDGPYRILVVEDREASRVLLVQLLTAVGFEVREAANGREAVAMWEAWEPHLIWMDMRMPVMDGYEATRCIKSQGDMQAPVVIALTAHAFEEERTTILAAGCDDFVRKPFQEAEIFDKMAQHLGVRYVYEEMAQPAEQEVEEQSPLTLTATDLAVLPADLIAELHQAARRGEADLILVLLDQIGPDHAPLARALARLVHEFRFDKIVALVESRQVDSPVGEDNDA